MNNFEILILQKRKIMKKYIYLLMILFLISCNEKDNNTNEDNFDRAKMLSDYSENYIIPNYQSFYNSIITLEESFIIINNNDDTQEIETFKNAFIDTYLKWQRVGFLTYGPGESNSLLPIFNSFPTSAQKIKSNIQSGEYNLLSAGNTDAISLPALDYLIFSTDEEIIEKYNNPNFKKYISDLINLLKTNTDKTLNEWQTFKINFSENNGNSVGSSLSRIVNSYNMYWEKDLRDGKIGIPLGIRTNGQPQTMRLEGVYSQKSLELLKESIKAYIDFFNNGENSLGLYDYLNNRRNAYGDGTLHQKINDNFNNIYKRLSEINGTLEDNIDNNTDELISIYQDIQKQIIFLKVDMPAIVGVSITYASNDGD